MKFLLMLTIGQGLPFINAIARGQGLLCLLLCLVIVEAPARPDSMTYHRGYVFGRAVVLDDNGYARWVAYDEKGHKVGDALATASGEYAEDSAYVVAASDMRSNQQRYQQALTDHPGAVLMTSAAFTATRFVNADGEQIDKPALDPWIAYLLVADSSQLLSTHNEGLVLARFSLNPDPSANTVEGSSTSLLVNKQGNILLQSPYRVALETGFIRTAAGDILDSVNGNLPKLIGDAQVLKPLPGVGVEGHLPNSIGYSDSNGFYEVAWWGVPCINYYYENPGYTMARLYSKRFNPKSDYAPLPYWVKKVTRVYCDGYRGMGAAMDFSQVPLQWPIAYPNPLDFGVDLNVLSGQAALYDPVSHERIPVTANPTRYRVTDSVIPMATADFLSQFDFDTDGKSDKSIQGYLTVDPEDSTNTRYFVAGQPPADEQAVWGIYLSGTGADPATDQPDFTKLADLEPAFRHEGLLAEMNEADLRNTDLYIIREADGSLVSERIGLSEAQDGFGDIDADQTDDAFFYRVESRGSGGFTGYDTGWRETAFWQSHSGLDMSKFGVAEADHLKPGEIIKIVAINRATGYLGSVRTQIKGAAGADGINLYFPIDEIKLYPPNLTVSVERTFKHRPQSQHSDYNTQAIGSEGAALIDDRSITIITEWLDWDGTPLPEVLARKEFGFTGRLAYLVDHQVLQSKPVGGAANGVAHFSIVPGKHLQVLKLNEKYQDNQHFYFQISGEPNTRHAVFSQNNRVGEAHFDPGSHTGKLAKRPATFVPFKVRVFDEQSTELARQVYREAQQQGFTTEQFESKYRWYYRPEMQFTIYDLTINTIERVEGGTATDIIQAQQPVISSGDDLLNLLYDLSGPEFDPLAYLNINDEKELIFQIGEEELVATLGEDQKIEFSNIEHLASLNPEDLLTMRLYVNQDAGNVLWEYAFEYLALDTQLAGYSPSSGQPLYLSADDPVVPLQAILLNYANRDPDTKLAARVRWYITGNASLEKQTDESDTLGVFLNTARLPNIAGSQAVVSIELQSSGSGKMSLPPFIVVPGAPAQISIESDTTPVSVEGVGEATYTIRATDQFGNPVTDGTGLSVTLSESLHLVELDGAFSGGQARLRIKGGPHPGEASFTVQVAGVTQTQPVEVHPLQFDWQVDPTLFAGARQNVELTVRNLQGQPAADVPVQMGTTYGYLLETELTTDADGRIRTTFSAPNVKGNGEITAQVGRSPLARTPIEVLYPSLEDRDLEVNHATLIGDKTTAGTITHQRYDNQPIEMPYNVTETIQVMGKEGEQVTVHIGDMGDPNLVPLAAYYLNAVNSDVIQDDTGRYHLNATQVTRASGTLLGGGHSVRFNADLGDSYLFGDNLTGLEQAQSLGVSLEVLPMAGAQGSLVNFGQGALQLSFDSQHRLVYQLITATGTHTLVSKPLMSGRWYRVAARYHDGQMTLWIDGEEAQQAVQGALTIQLAGNSSEAERADPGRRHDLEIGKGFTGQLNSVKWVDWSGQPVMTFADGSVATTVTLPVPVAQQPLAYVDLTIRSTGRMNSQGSQLGLQRVAIHTSKVRQYASLVNTASFATLAGLYVETLADDAPPINLAGLQPQSTPPPYAVAGVAVLHYLVPSAHANSTVQSFGWGLLNFLIPLESFEILFQQLGYLVSDPDKFEADEFVIALVDAITLFPPAKPLKLFTTPLKAMTRAMKAVNPKFAKHFGGFIDRVMQKAKKGDFDTVWNLLPFLVIAAEMYTDDEAREGLMFLVRTVGSADDLVAWVDYLALPVDGWLGEGDPPEVEPFPDDPQTVWNWSRWLGIESAYAAARVRRIDGTVFGRALLKVAQKIDREAAATLPQALKIIKDNLKVTDFKELRKKVFKSDMLTSAAWLATKGGARSLRNFMVGKSNARYSPVLIASTIGYLGWESACGIALDKQNEGTLDPDTDVTPDDLGCGTIGFNEQVREQVARKIGIVFADSATAQLMEERVDDDKLTVVGGSGHGALFHLVQIAQYQLQHRYAGGAAIKGVELSRYVALFLDETKVPQQNEELVCGKTQDGCYLKRLRYVDIVLDAAEGEHWIELKSWSAQGESGPARYSLVAEKIAGNFVRWDITKSAVKGKSTTLHRQFSLDRAANVIDAAWLTKRETQQSTYEEQVAVADFEWRFQVFKVTDRKTKKKEVSPLLGKANERKTLRYLVTARPEAKGLNDIEKAKRLQQDSFGGDTGISSHMKLVTAGTLMKDLAKGGFDMAVDVIEDTINSD